MDSKMRRTVLRAALALTALATTAAAPAATGATAAPDCARARCIAYGTAQPLGDGTVRTYADIDHKRPVAVGAGFSERAFDHLPTAMTDRHHCFDVNGNGVIEEMTECAGGHERILDLPHELLALAGVPVEWVLLNWDPMGHGPAGIYDKPHLDVHFYLRPKAERDAIRPGPCAIVVNCEDFATASKPVPARYLPTDHVDKGLVEVAMGNHLPDRTAGEWNGVPFTRTFIYGVYDGQLTYLEPMVTLTTVQQARGGPVSEECRDTKQPQEWQQPGWYPRQYCVRYAADRKEYTISLEDFAPHG